MNDNLSRLRDIKHQNAKELRSAYSKLYVQLAKYSGKDAVLEW